MSVPAAAVLIVGVVILLVALNELRGPLASYRAAVAEDAKAEAGAEDESVVNAILRREIRDAVAGIVVGSAVILVAVLVIR